MLTTKEKERERDDDADDDGDIFVGLISMLIKDEFVKRYKNE